MKAMPATSPQYTLHDESHFLRVVELMAMVNSLHPLVKLCLKPRNIDPLSEFASTLVPCIVDAIYSKEQKNH